MIAKKLRLTLTRCWRCCASRMCSAVQACSRPPRASTPASSSGGLLWHAVCGAWGVLWVQQLWTCGARSSRRVVPGKSVCLFRPAHHPHASCSGTHDAPAAGCGAGAVARGGGARAQAEARDGGGNGGADGMNSAAPTMHARWPTVYLYRGWWGAVDGPPGGWPPAGSWLLHNCCNQSLRE